jgi:menaquinone-dependent protoporphyrinogen oxidase
MKRREVVRALAVAPVAAVGLVERWGHRTAVPADGRILMLYSTREGQALRIAEFMADLAEEAGHPVELADLARQSGAVTGSPAAVLVTASIHMARHGKEVARWVAANGPLLDRTSSAFLSVSLSAAQESKRDDARGYVDDLLAETGWRPGLTGLAAGALRYTSYGFIRRTMMRKIAEEGALPTDTSRDHEFTDWADVWAFTERFLQTAPAPLPRTDAEKRRAS